MNKVIIIGATSGIGRQLAKLYARKNWLVGATGRRIALLQSLQKEFPENIVIECFDVTEEENIECIKNLTQQLGGLDLLIYNSGNRQKLTSTDYTTVENTHSIKVSGFEEIMKFSFNYFVLEGKGHIAAAIPLALKNSSHIPTYTAGKNFYSNYMDALSLKAFKLKLPITISDIYQKSKKNKIAKEKKTVEPYPVYKAAEQIYRSLESKKRKIYISRSSWLMAKLVYIMPVSVYKKWGAIFCVLL